MGSGVQISVRTGGTQGMTAKSKFPESFALDKDSVGPRRVFILPWEGN
jgi:hypothetical protein